MEGSRNMQSAFSFKLQMKSIPAAIRACMRHGGLLPVPRGYDGWPLPRQEIRILPEYIQLLRAEIHNQHLSAPPCDLNQPRSTQGF